MFLACIFVDYSVHEESPKKKKKKKKERINIQKSEASHPNLIC